MLLLEDLSEVKKGKDKQYDCVRKYWKSIFDIKDTDEMKFPLIQKVVLFAFSIAKANADVEWVFSQVFRIVDKERNGLGTDTLRSLFITKKFLQTIGSCLDSRVDDRMMVSITLSHRKYTERTRSDKNDKCCVH